MLREKDFEAIHGIKERSAIEFADWIHSSGWTKNSNGTWEHKDYGELKNTGHLYLLFWHEDVAYSSIRRIRK